jgi:Protein of unknown function (DUF1579)
MTKQIKITLAFLIIAAATSGPLVSRNARGQDKQKPDEKAMMEAWQKFMTPGKELEEMAKKVGNWDVEMIDYSAGEHKSQATAEIKMLMGGRYQEIKLKGTVMGQPFEGCATNGFDNARKVYAGTWIDNMGTSITLAEGTATDADTIEMKGQMDDPMTGKQIDFRNVTKNVDADHFTYDIYCKVQGQDQKMMSANYSRAK